MPVITGGVHKALEQSPPEMAIVTTGVADLSETACALIVGGVRRILLEKPGGADKTEIIAVVNAAKKNKAEVQIAYNRRFYASTFAAQKIIEDDGGVVSYRYFIF